MVDRDGRGEGSGPLQCSTHTSPSQHLARVAVVSVVVVMVVVVVPSHPTMAPDTLALLDDVTETWGWC